MEHILGLWGIYDFICQLPILLVDLAHVLECHFLRVVSRCMLNIIIALKLG